MVSSSGPGDPVPALPFGDGGSALPLLPPVSTSRLSSPPLIRFPGPSLFLPFVFYFGLEIIAGLPQLSY